MARRSPVMLAAALALCLGSRLAAQEPNEDVAFAQSDDGTLVHQRSGLRFPSEAAGFQLGNTAAFAPDGAYVGLEYTRAISADGMLTLRVAVVNLPGLSPREHYAITKPTALHSLEQARPVREGAFRRVRGARAYRGLFTGVRDGIAWMQGLWTFEHGEWDLRVSADFPRIDAIQADEAIAEFVRALNRTNGQRWPREAPAADDGERPKASSRSG